jgi:hypothetical protein
MNTRSRESYGLNIISMLIVGAAKSVDSHRISCNPVRTPCRRCLRLVILKRSANWKRVAKHGATQKAGRCLSRVNVRALPYAEEASLTGKS